MMRFSSQLKTATIRVARIFALAAIGLFAISASAPSASAVTQTPFHEQKIGATCSGSPKFECTCRFADVPSFTLRLITHASIGAELPIGTRILQVFLEFRYDDDSAVRAQHYIPEVREVFVSRGQFFSASGSMFARPYGSSTPYLTVKYDSQIPLGSKFRCVIEGYTETP
jgi:hypothetical protein